MAALPMGNRIEISLILVASMRDMIFAIILPELRATSN
jgi:hypothetical protein